MLREVVGRTETLLYRRGNFNGTLDDLICDALLAGARRRDRAVAGLPLGHAACCPARTITREDIYNATAITYPPVYRMTMTGARLKEVLEDVADNLFNPDPYYQQGGDMVRVGGLGYTIDVAKPIGSRISDHDASANRQADRARARTTSSPAGRASTKAPKVRRSGTWSSAISPRKRRVRSRRTRA